VPLSPARTLQLALTLQPDARQVVAVTGASTFDRRWDTVARETRASRSPDPWSESAAVQLELPPVETSKMYLGVRRVSDGATGLASRCEPSRQLASSIYHRLHRQASRCGPEITLFSGGGSGSV
jgi:hypothetical protein